MNCSPELWFCSNAAVSLRWPLYPASFLMSQRLLKWNKHPPCSASISTLEAPNWRIRKERHLMFINSRWNLFKNCQIFLNFFSVWFFIGEEDNNYLNIFVFLFHKLIKPFWFLSWPNKHHRHKQTRNEFAKADVLYWRNLLCQTFLFLHYVWQVDSKRKFVPRSPQSHDIARTLWTVHHFLNMLSRVSSSSEDITSLRLRSNSSLFLNYRLRVFGCTTRWGCLKKNHS